MIREKVKSALDFANKEGVGARVKIPVQTIRRVKLDSLTEEMTEQLRELGISDCGSSNLATEFPIPEECLESVDWPKEDLALEQAYVEVGPDEYRYAGYICSGGDDQLREGKAVLRFYVIWDEVPMPRYFVRVAVLDDSILGL